MSVEKLDPPRPAISDRAHIALHRFCSGLYLVALGIYLLQILRASPFKETDPLHLIICAGLSCCLGVAIGLTLLRFIVESVRSKIFIAKINNKRDDAVYAYKMTQSSSGILAIFLNSERQLLEYEVNTPIWIQRSSVQTRKVLELSAEAERLHLELSDLMEGYLMQSTQSSNTEMRKKITLHK